MKRTGHVAILCLLAATGLVHAGALKVRGEFLVNTYTTHDQRKADVAAGRGGFVVVWESQEQDGSSWGVFGQFFNSAGFSVRGEFQANTYTEFSQRYPAVAMHPSGGFVVAWQSDVQDGSDYGVFARRFDETGFPVGIEVQVNTYTSGPQYDPDVAIDGEGNFVVVWTSYGQAGTANSIFAQRFDRAGLKVGPEFQVDTDTAYGQYYPAVAMSSSGDFVVAWESYPWDGDFFGIAVQIYDRNGSPVGGNFQANTYTTGVQGEPGVAMNGAGEILVAWDSDLQDGSQDGTFAQLFDINGTPIGQELQVNTYTTGAQRDPKVAADESGEFIVVWPSQNQDLSSDGVFGQIVDSAGGRFGDEFQVPTYTTGNQTRPSVAAGPPGRFTVVWDDPTADGYALGVVGQVFLAHSPELTGPAGPLDCSDPANVATRPTFTWDTDNYEAFKVWMGSSPGFEKGTRVTSGDRAIKTGSWMPSRKKWKKACQKSLTQSVIPNNLLLYVAVGGIDKDLPRSDPARKRLSPAVEFDVTP